MLRNLIESDQDEVPVEEALAAPPRWERVLAELRARFPSYFNDLDRFLETRGYHGVRIQRAYLNVIEPLLQSRASSGIERDWAELSDDELIEFINAGIKREKILLNRSPDIPRAQEVAQGGPRVNVALVLDSEASE